jgi:hypothetical protein
MSEGSGDSGYGGTASRTGSKRSGKARPRLRTAFELQQSLTPCTRPRKPATVKGPSKPAQMVQVAATRLVWPAR